MKRFALTVLILLSLPTWQSSAQTTPTLPSSPPPTESSVIQQRLDLALLIAQRNYWKDRSDNFEQAAKQIEKRLQDLEQSSKDSPDPQTLQAEIASLRQQLSEARDSLKASHDTSDTLDQKIKAQQGVIDKAETDHKTEMDAQRVRVRIWRAAALVSAGASGGAILGKGDIGTAGIGAGAGLALDLILEAFGQ